MKLMLYADDPLASDPSQLARVFWVLQALKWSEAETNFPASVHLQSSWEDKLCLPEKKEAVSQMYA